MGPREPESDAGFQPAAPRREDDAVVTPEPLGSRPTGKPGRLQSRRARLVVALTGGFLARLCLGGVGAFMVLYDAATEIKRTEPDAVVNDFLGAYLRSRDDDAAALYQCDPEGDISQLATFRGDTERREKEFSTGISISYSIVAMTINGSNGVVKVDVTRTITGGAGRDGSTWQFAVADQDGWRVCGAAQIS